MLLISIITAAIVVMLPRVKRTTQSMLKSAADQIGDQKGADQTFNDVERAYLVNSRTATSSVVDDGRTDVSGVINQTFNETTTTSTASFTNAGWSRE